MLSQALEGNEVRADVSNRGNPDEEPRYIEGKVVSVGKKYPDYIEDLKSEGYEFSITNHRTGTKTDMAYVLDDPPFCLIREADSRNYHVVPVSRCERKSFSVTEPDGNMDEKEQCDKCGWTFPAGAGLNLNRKLDIGWYDEVVYRAETDILLCGGCKADYNDRSSVGRYLFRRDHIDREIFPERA